MIETANAPIHFVFASPRSGTTWLAQAINRHPEILASEQRLFGNFCEVWPNPDGSTSPRQTLDSFVRHFAFHYRVGFPEQAVESLQQQLLQHSLRSLIDFGLQHSGKRILVDKITPYLGTSERVLQQIKIFFPHAKLIHLVRDGRDVVTSGVFDWIERGSLEATRYKVFVQGDDRQRMTRFFDDEILQQWTQYWRQPQHAMLAHADPPLSVLTIRYEDMLQDQAAQLGRIFAFLEIEATADQCQRWASEVTFEKTTGRKAGQALATAKARKGVHGDWHNYFTQADAEFFQEHCGHLLEHFDYSANQDWPQHCPTHL